jgi:hypothetical protein
MLQTTFSGHRNSHAFGEAIWIVAGIIVLMAFGDELVLLSLAVAIAAMTTAWWVHHRLGRRAQTTDAQLAPVTHLRPREPQTPSSRRASAA